MEDRLLFIDTETGGLDPTQHSLLSIAMVVCKNMEILESLEIFINDGKLNVTDEALKINKIDLEKHKEISLSPGEAISKILDFLKRNFDTNEKITMAGHNINFDVNFLRFFLAQNKENFSKYFSHRFIDTSSILYYLYLSGNLKDKVLSSSDAFAFFGISVEGRHTALGDAIATAKLFTNLLQLTRKKLKISKLNLGKQLELFDKNLSGS